MGAPRVISLFTGAGGLDYGLEAAGFETRLAVELDADCCATISQNRSWRFLQRSVLDLTGRDLMKAAGLRQKEVDLMVGGPPCQPFSKAGFWVGKGPKRLADERAKTLLAFLNLVEQVRPKVVLLENVAALGFHARDEGLQLILRRFRGINRRLGTRYVPTYAALDAAAFGVPQHRERLILVADRDGEEFKFPAPTHGKTVNTPDQMPLQPFRNAWDALGDEEPTEPGLNASGQWAELLPSIPEGRNYLFHTDRGAKEGGVALFGWRCRYWTFLLKLAKNRPSWTIQAQPGPSAGPFHWKNRRLSIRELCRIQTIPDDIVIFGDRGSAQRQVGNAVPSLLAEVLGLEIRQQLLGLSALPGPLRLLPRMRVSVPLPEQPQPVPEKYHPLIGLHPAHPGVGKGPGATRLLKAEQLKLLEISRTPLQRQKTA